MHRSVRAHFLAVSSVLAAAASFLAASPALAHDQPEPHEHKASAHAAAPEEHEHDHAPPRIDLVADAVFGFGGTVPALNYTIPTTLDRNPQTSMATTPVVVDSYILGGGLRVTKSVRVFARLPLVHASFDPDYVKDRRGTQNIGNLEIGAGLVAPEEQKIAILPKLALALPTTSGMPLPPAEEVEGNPGGNYGRATRDYYAMLQAANGSRGYEESALFASKRLGLTPSVEARIHAGKIEVSPFLAAAILFSTASVAKEKVAGDLVAGAQARMEVTGPLDIALRAWLNYAFVKEERSASTLVVVEPQLLLRLGPVTPYVGFLIPILPSEKGDSTTEEHAPAFDPRFLSLRLGAVAAF